MKQDKILDSYLADKVQEYNAPFEEAHWQHALAQLEEDEKRRPLIWFKGLATLLGILVVGAVAYLWANKSTSVQSAEPIVAQQSVAQNINTAPEVTTTKANEIPAKKDEAQNSSAEDKNAKNIYTEHATSGNTNINNAPQQETQSTFYATPINKRVTRKEQKAKAVSIANETNSNTIHNENDKTPEVENAIVKTQAIEITEAIKAVPKEKIELLKAKKTFANKVINKTAAAKNKQDKILDMPKEASEKLNEARVNEAIKYVSVKEVAHTGSDKRIDVEKSKSDDIKNIVTTAEANIANTSAVEEIQVPSILPKKAQLPETKNAVQPTTVELKARSINTSIAGAKTEEITKQEDVKTPQKKLNLSWLKHPFVEAAFSAAQAPEAPVYLPNYDKLKSYSAWVGLGWQMPLNAKMFVLFGASASETNNLSYTMLRNRSGGTGVGSTDTGTYTFQHLSLAQLFIPVNLGYRIAPRHSLLLGASVSTPLGLHVAEKDFGTIVFNKRWQSNQGYAMQMFANLSYQFEVLKNLYAYGVYMQGLTDMTVPTFTGSTVVDRNSRANVGVRYQF
jgi:hypothetical protein